MKKNIILLLFSCFAGAYSYAQVTLVQFSTTTYSSPVDIKNAGDDRLFIVQQGGAIMISDTAGVKKTTPFLNISTRLVSGGEQGLLGLAFDPNYKTNGYFYVDYTTNAPSGTTHISRFKVSAINPDSADPNSEKILMKIWQPYTNHNGGNVMFGPDGYLYIFMGDGGNGGDPQNRAQNPDSLLGKILRIDVNDTLYKIPADNPFVDKTGRDEIWSLGWRNPWRGSFDRWTGDMWIGDVGQNLWEEVDFQKASSKGGENYGWRCYEGNHNYNTAGCGAMSNYVAAVYEFAHSGNAAVVGGYVYRGAEFSDMFGKYFLTDEYTSTYGFRTLVPNGSGGFTAALLGALGRSAVVTFGEDRWGELYVSDYANGRIYKFQGTACSPVAFISDSSKIYVCDTVSPLPLRTPDGKYFHYQWYANGSPVSNSDNDTLLVTAPGSYYVVSTNNASCTATSSTIEVIWPAPVSFSGLDTFYCVSSAPVPLIGTPPGGSFSGSGVSGSMFDPATANLGIDTVVYTYTDNISGCTNSYSSTVVVDACLSVSEKQLLPCLKLYPSPNRGEFNVIFNTFSNENIKGEIADALGRIVYREEWNLSAGFYVMPIKPGHLAKGIYTFKATSGEQSSVHRFTVQ